MFGSGNNGAVPRGTTHEAAQFVAEVRENSFNEKANVKKQSEKSNKLDV